MKELSIKYTLGLRIKLKINLKKYVEQLQAHHRWERMKRNSI